jgi:hypothetical protein
MPNPTLRRSSLRCRWPALVALPSLLAPFAAHAGPPTPIVTITYGPASAISVPTMGSALSIALAALLLVAGFRVLRAAQPGVVSGLALMALSGALLTVGGYDTIRGAAAVVLSSNVELDSSSGGTVEITDYGTKCLENVTDDPLQIQEVAVRFGDELVNLDPYFGCLSNAGAPFPQCEGNAGTVLDSGDFCYVSPDE